MKYCSVILFSLLLQTTGVSQNRSYPFDQLYKLDSIGQSNSIGRHFGSLYFGFLQMVEKELETADTTTQ